MKITNKILALALTLTCCFVSLFSYNSSVVAVENTQSMFSVTNGGFEEWSKKGSGLLSYYAPKDWESDEFSLTKQETTIVYDGNYSLKIQNGYGATIKGKVDYAFTANSTYRFGVRIYSATENGGKLTLSVDAGENGLTVQTFSVVGANAWLNYYIDVTFGANQETANLTVKIENNVADCYLDGVYAEEVLPIKMVKGASMRLSATNSGLRFVGRIDKSIYDSYLSSYTSVSVGMIITPTDELVGLDDFTVEELKENTTDYLDIKAERWNNESSAERNGYYGFNCVITDILTQNIDRKFSARAYLKYFDGNSDRIIYSDYSHQDNARSIYEVATAVLENVEEYTAEEQKIIRYYSSAVKTVSTKEDFNHSGDEMSFNFEGNKGMIRVITDGQALVSVNGTDVTVIGDNSYAIEMDGSSVSVRILNGTEVIVKHYAAYQ